MEIQLGKELDIESWMNLVDQVKESFPGLEMAEHRQTVLEFMGRNEAICAKAGGKIVGVLLFSKTDAMLCFLAVDPQYRRRHIGEKMVEFMLPLMNAGRDVVVTTYREDAPAGRAARAFYQKLGFVPGRLTEEFGSPVQEFVLKRREGT